MNRVERGTRVEVIRGLGMGGAERLLIDRLAAEGEREGETGTDVVIVNVAPEQNALEEELRGPGRCVYHPPLRGRWRAILSSVPFFLTLPRDTIVVCHSPAPSMILRLLRVMLPYRPYRMIDVVHSTHFHKSYKWFEKFIIAQPDSTIAVSDDVFKSMSGSNRGPLQTVHGGVPREDMMVWLAANPDHWEATRRAMGLAPDATVVSFVANLRPAKNHDLVLDVAKELGESVTVVLVGDGPERARLESRIRSERLENVRLMGQQPSAWKFIAASDAVLHLSHWEGLPVALMEAAALNVPIVTNDFPGARELARMTDTLECVAGNSPSAIAQACRRKLIVNQSSPRSLRFMHPDNYWDIRRYLSDLDRIFQEVAQL